MVLIFAFVSTFALGFAFKSITTSSNYSQKPHKKVTGIGGIFSNAKTLKNAGMVQRKFGIKHQ